MSSNSYSVPSETTRRNLLSSFEKEIRSSESNSEGSVGKVEVEFTVGGECLCSIFAIWVVVILGSGLLREAGG